MKILITKLYWQSSTVMTTGLSVYSVVCVADCLNEALEIMNQAVMEHSQPGARENIAYLTLTERRRAFEPERRDVPEVGCCWKYLSANVFYWLYALPMLFCPLCLVFV